MQIFSIRSQFSIEFQYEYMFNQSYAGPQKVMIIVQN